MIASLFLPSQSPDPIPQEPPKLLGDCGFMVGQGQRQRQGAEEVGAGPGAAAGDRLFFAFPLGLAWPPPCLRLLPLPADPAAPAAWLLPAAPGSLLTLPAHPA